MLDLEIFRIAFVVVLLSVNTIYDIRYRTIFGSDKTNFIVGCIGFTLLLLDAIGEPLSYDFVMMVICITFVLLLWRVRVIASGDVVVSLIFCAVLPTNFIPLTTLFLALILAVIITLVYNITLNVQTKHRGEKLFHDFDSSLFIKILAFGLSHKKRAWEKHVLSIENNGKLDLITSSFDKGFNTKNETIVCVTVPILPLMLISFPIVLVMTSIFINFLTLKFY